MKIEFARLDKIEKIFKEGAKKANKMIERFSTEKT